jgi:5-formyltetrahydrofolate cyclo-ligase
MDKRTLRSELRAQRRAFVARLDPALTRLHALAIARILLVEAGDAKAVAAYVPCGFEADPLPFVELAAMGGRVTALPYFSSKTSPMSFRAWHSGEKMEPGPFGMEQPRAKATEIEPHAVIVPLIGFDRRLFRLGQGGGHYDRYFAAHPHARRIGLAWSAQEAERLPVDEWDIPLHTIVTERGVFQGSDQ